MAGEIFIADKATLDRVDDNVEAITTIVTNTFTKSDNIISKVDTSNTSLISVHEKLDRANTTLDSTSGKVDVVSGKLDSVTNTVNNINTNTLKDIGYYDISKLNKVVVGTKVSGSVNETNILNVSGSGVIYAIVFSSPANVTTSAYITVDGQTIFNRRISSAESGSYNGLICSDIPISYSTAGTSALLPGGPLKIAAVPLVGFNQTKIDSVGILLLNKPFRFNSSLSVVVNAGTIDTVNTSYYYVLD